MGAQILGQLIGTVIGAAIGSLIGALFVQLATNWVCKFKPPYGMAYKACFLAYLASSIIGFFVGLLISVSGREMGGASLILLMIIGFFVGAVLYGMMIKHPESGPIGFGKACLVSLIQLIIGVIIAGVIGLIVFVAMFA